MLVWQVIAFDTPAACSCCLVGRVLRTVRSSLTLIGVLLNVAHLLYNMTLVIHVGIQTLHLESSRVVLRVRGLGLRALGFKHTIRKRRI